LEEEAIGPRREDHVIIVGFGLGGRNLARVLRSVEIPYVILEMNPEAVRRSQAEGEPIAYGDCTRAEVLEHMGIARARVLVIAISDPAATRRAVQIARRLSPTLHIVARTRFSTEIDELKALGADEIVPEDLVASVELFARVLHEYQVPRNQIIELIDRIRSDQYEALRVRHPERLNLLQREIAAHGEIDSVLIRPDSPAVGRTVGELRLRTATGATLLTVRRGGRLLSNPDAALRFEPGDVAILFGDRSQIDDAIVLLDPTMTRSPLTEPARDGVASGHPPEPKLESDSKSGRGEC
jgi:CPA2 family monovalent cation:H+ antiporter-2